MQSKNKPAPSASERMHIDRIKAMTCAVCAAPPPSECHELRQGLWFAAIPLCESCHRGPVNGWHGQRRLWAIKKWDELDALADTVKRLV